MEERKPLNNRKKLLIKAAKKRHGSIRPVANVKDLDESFTTHHDALLFWYNTDDGSTHILKDNGSNESGGDKETNET
ncbi:MAG: hypothetical protein GF401_05960 [Chitinivibrionales bacterium]|nr:hypothetical protein [Chitinivibrionales bacterium]